MKLKDTTKVNTTINTAFKNNDTYSFYIDCNVDDPYDTTLWNWIAGMPSESVGGHLNGSITPNQLSIGTIDGIYEFYINMVEPALQYVVTIINFIGDPKAYKVRFTLDGKTVTLSYDPANANNVGFVNYSYTANASPSNLRNQTIFAQHRNQTVDIRIEVINV